MHSAAANEYLDLLFGQSEGYVAVAYKGPRNSWQEQQFEWPTDRQKLLWWADQHARGDVFICPALRGDAHTRRKNDGVDMHWLWADVDMDKVPEGKQSLVRQRIAQLGSYVVSSGTGDNCHVYVELDRAVTVAEHYALNTGLRDYLYADAKHADNSLLRLPGTTNHKPDAGAVGARGGNGKRFRVDSLRKLRAFNRVVGGVSGGVVDWTRVDVSDVPAKLRRLASMSVDEATSRYGGRYKAEWAVIGDLHRAGLTVDEIHSLMDTFPPALDKADDEHGAHDVHKTVAKRLRAIEDAQRVIDEGGDDDSPFHDLSDEELAEHEKQAPDNPALRKELDRREVRRQADHIEAMRRFMAPPDDVSWNAADALRNPPEGHKYLIGPNEDGTKGLAGLKHNVVITAQYKTGKTSMVLASLARSLCDGVPFLDQFPTPMRVVGHWNMEMEGNELLHDYIGVADFDYPHNLHVANLRGYGVNILTELGKAWAVQWLRDRGVQVWTIDSLARLLRMCGVKEQDNFEVLNVLMAIDEIKIEADVDVCFVIAHTGRVEMAEGSERARGATVIDDWPDARWIITKQGEIRFIAVEGRGVALPATSLNFNHETKVSTLGVRGKDEVAADGAVQCVVKIVEANAGVSKTTLANMVRRVLSCGSAAAVDAIEDAVVGGWIEPRRVTKPGGGRATIKHYPIVDDGGEGRVKRRVLDGRAASRGPRRGGA